MPVLSDGMVWDAFEVAPCSGISPLELYVNDIYIYGSVYLVSVSLIFFVTCISESLVILANCKPDKSVLWHFHKAQGGPEGSAHQEKPDLRTEHLGACVVRWYGLGCV